MFIFLRLPLTIRALRCSRNWTLVAIRAKLIADGTATLVVLVSTCYRADQARENSGQELMLNALLSAIRPATLRMITTVSWSQVDSRSVVLAMYRCFLRS